MTNAFLKVEWFACNHGLIYHQAVVSQGVQVRQSIINSFRMRNWRWLSEKQCCSVRFKSSLILVPLFVMRILNQLFWFHHHFHSKINEMYITDLTTSMIHTNQLGTSALWFNFVFLIINGSHSFQIVSQASLPLLYSKFWFCHFLVICQVTKQQ